MRAHPAGKKSANPIAMKASEKTRKPSSLYPELSIVSYQPFDFDRLTYSDKVFYARTHQKKKAEK